MSTYLGKALVGLLAACTVLLGAIQYGKVSQRRKDTEKQLQSYIDTQKVITDVEVSDDRGAALERMRRNGWIISSNMLDPDPKADPK